MKKKIILLQYSIRRRILNTLYIEHNHSNTQKKFGGNFPKKGKYLNFLKVEKELQITLLFKIFHARWKEKGVGYFLVFFFFFLNVEILLVHWWKANKLGIDKRVK